MEVLDIQYVEAVQQIRLTPLGWAKTKGIDLSTCNFWCIGNNREALQAKVARFDPWFGDNLVQHNMLIVNTGVFPVSGSEDFVGWVQVFNEPSKARTLDDALHALLAARGTACPRPV